MGDRHFSPNFGRHFVLPQSEKRGSSQLSGMPDVAQLALVVDAEHQRSKMFSRSRGFGNASDHGLLLHARLDLEPGFAASSRLPVDHPTSASCSFNPDL